LLFQLHQIRHFLLHSKSFEIVIPGRKPKQKVSDAPDPRTFRLLP
jgi:hypothetical protein